jgi:hypothetical protein
MENILSNLSKKFKVREPRLTHSGQDHKITAWVMLGNTYYNFMQVSFLSIFPHTYALIAGFIWISDTSLFNTLLCQQMAHDYGKVNTIRYVYKESVSC